MLDDAADSWWARGAWWDGRLGDAGVEWGMPKHTHTHTQREGGSRTSSPLTRIIRIDHGELARCGFLTRGHQRMDRQGERSRLAAQTLLLLRQVPPLATLLGCLRSGTLVTSSVSEPTECPSEVIRLLRCESVSLPKKTPSQRFGCRSYMTPRIRTAGGSLVCSPLVRTHLSPKSISAKIDVKMGT